VVLNAQNEFVSVTGARKVKDVKVGGEPIDPAKTYVLASHNYMLLDGGDGFTMFKGANIVVQPVLLDNQVLITYIEDYLDGVVGEEYANPYGQGRIKILTSDSAPWAAGAIGWADDNGLIPDNLRYDYTAKLTRAEMAQLIAGYIEFFQGEEIVLPEDYEDPFDDTDDEYVLKLASIGVVHGSGGSFAPDDEFPRHSLGVLFVNAIEYLIGEALEDFEPTFSDIDDCPDWAKEAIGKLQNAGVFQGSGGKFAPEDDFTRQAAYTLLWKIDGFVAD
jgi:hypothetical protein